MGGLFNDVDISEDHAKSEDPVHENEELGVFKLEITVC